MRVGGCVLKEGGEIILRFVLRDLMGFEVLDGREGGGGRHRL